MATYLSGQGWVIARTTRLVQNPDHMTGTLLDPDQGRRDFIAFGAGSEKSQRAQTLLLGNEVRYVCEDRGGDRYVLTEATLVSDNPDIKQNPQKLRQFFLLCDVWYHLIQEERAYPEVVALLELLKARPQTHHFVLVYLVHLFRDEALLPPWESMEEARGEFLADIGLAHWTMGTGSERFLRDAYHQPLSFFVDKIPSPAVMNEVLVLLRAVYQSYTGEALLSLE